MMVMVDKMMRMLMMGKCDEKGGVVYKGQHKMLMVVVREKMMIMRNGGGHGDDDDGDGGQAVIDEGV